MTESTAVSGAAHPFAQLCAEHRVIRAVLAAIEREVARMQVSFEVRLAFWLQVLAFLEHYADAAHHGKEDHVLWPALVRAGLSREHGPLATVCLDYEQGSMARGRMVEALASQDAPTLARVAAICVRQLQRQIDKEEQVLFPLACELLDGAAVHDVHRGFEEQTAAIGDAQYRQSMQLADSLTATAC